MKYPSTKYTITNLGSPLEHAMTKRVMDEVTMKLRDSMCEATIGDINSINGASGGGGSQSGGGISTGTGISGSAGYGSITYYGTYGTTTTGNTTLASPGGFGYTISAAIDEECNVVEQSDSPDLPPIVLNTFDENGNKVKMTLKPEASISASDVMKLCMLITCIGTNPEAFNALAYVKKNGLAQHFTYAS